MSWFGETFGDSLNSIKGQITKITKEVLADNEATNSTGQEAENDLVRELEALCESKDLEIASLRDEFNKLHNQYKSQIEFLKSESKKKGNQPNCDSDNLEIGKLKNELEELRQDRDHLNSCLDELQSEHQTNLNEVISVRDKYKSELETLKKEFNSVKAKLEDTGTEDIKVTTSDEISLLKSKISELSLQLQKEKQDLVTIVNKEKETQNAFREQVDKLLEDIETIRKDKDEAEKDRRHIQVENKDLKNKLIEKDKENKESEIKLKILLNENEELLKKCQKEELVESKLSSLIKTETEVEGKLKHLLQILKVDVEKITRENTLIELVNMVENKLHEKCNELNENLKASTNNLEVEIERLKEENKNFQNKLKISMESNTEMERKCQEEISFLKNAISEMKTQEQDSINPYQTNDVKKLEQEIAQCMSLLLAKDNEIMEYSKSLNNLEQELEDVRASCVTAEEELLAVKEEKKNLEEENASLRNSCSSINEGNVELEEKLKFVESEKINLDHINTELQNKLKFVESEKINLDHINTELQNKTDILEKQLDKLMSSSSEKIKMLEEELNKATVTKSERDKVLASLQNENVNLKQELENMKAQVIIKESNLEELMKANTFLQDEVNKLQVQNNKLVNSEKEVKKWKDASIDLQIQQEDLIARREELENECLKLKSELDTGLGIKTAEIEQLKITNSNLMKSCNELHHQLETKVQAEQFSVTKECELEKACQEKSELILQLQEENAELKSRVQKFQEQLKMQMTQSQSQITAKEDAQQHRRSKSAVDTEPTFMADSQMSADVTLLKQAVQQEQARYQLLQHQFQEISNKEAGARKEFERLKQHLIEVEDHYTEEAVENEKIINDLKSKLVAAEEQLHNSSTLYTSLKVRDNQHLESLQSQVRMVSIQRDDLQGKLSTAEDEVQKHKASLMSLQIVLEQFQQDKDRELEEVAMKYEKQLQLSRDHYRDLEVEIQGLKNQMAEAKNGLSAASRLGEQLEKKSQQVTELEENLNFMNKRVAELEESLTNANQANSSKIDKSLIKNLVVGYVLSTNGDRKSQVLKIMASVLDFDQEERTKMGVDANRSGWLSNILHPKGDGSPSSQSLSEAFIRFLENESRPQPQLKLLPEQLEANTPRTSRASPKPTGRLTELMLPTFNSPQENDSSIILKNVLKHS